MKFARGAETDPSRRLPLWLGSSAGAALCGFLTALPWLDERHFVTPWIGLTVWIAISSGQPVHLAFRLWLLGGLVAVATWFHWLPSVAARQIDVSLFSGTMMALLATTWDAFRFGVFGFIVAWLRTRGMRGTLVGPTVWVGLEWVWPHVFPWRLGQSQLGWLSLCQITEATGVYGLSFLLVWGAAIAAGFLRKATGDTPSQASRRRPLEAFVCVALIAGSSVWGLARMKAVDRVSIESRSMNVAIVQPGSRNDFLPTLRSLTRGIPIEFDLAVWGEATIGDFSLSLRSFHNPVDVGAQSRFGEDDPQPCPGLGRPLLCGGGSFVSGTQQSGPFRNTAYLIDPHEAIIGRYHKRVLMPWGEYAIGQQWIPGLRDLLTTADPLVPGTTADPLICPDGSRIGVLICYEDLMPNPARETVLSGAEVLVDLNNLAVFSGTAALRQHQHLARFRAIESRRWLVRCGTVGSSALISASGRVVEQLPVDKPAAIVVQVPLLNAETIYTRWGDWFAAACMVAGCAVMAASVVRRRCK